MKIDFIIIQIELLLDFISFSKETIFLLCR